VTEVMKQPQYSPMSVAEMALSLYAVNGGYMDKVDRKKTVDFEMALQAFAKTNYGDLLKQINEKPELSKEVDAALKKCCDDFVATGAY
jgi:F-type H+-transporting ATPase subunit alpha